MALTGGRTDESIITRQHLLMTCFPHAGSGGALFLTDHANANSGLGAVSWQERLPYLVQLQTVMTAWESPKPPAFNIARKPLEEYTEKEMLDLENAVTLYYTQTFFNHFGRVAMTPHHL